MKRETQLFRFIKGPIFTELLMADEINRASPRTQSALLQAMQEGHVTIAVNVTNFHTPSMYSHPESTWTRRTYPLPKRNRSLPHASGYHIPTFDAERKFFSRQQAPTEANAEAVMTPQDLLHCKPCSQHAVGDSIVDAIFHLCALPAPKKEQKKSHSMGPRAKG